MSSTRGSNTQLRPVRFSADVETGATFFELLGLRRELVPGQLRVTDPDRQVVSVIAA